LYASATSVERLCAKKEDPKTKNLVQNNVCTLEIKYRDLIQWSKSSFFYLERNFLVRETIKTTSLEELSTREWYRKRWITAVEQCPSGISPLMRRKAKIAEYSDLITTKHDCCLPLTSRATTVL